MEKPHTRLQSPSPRNAGANSVVKVTPDNFKKDFNSKLSRGYASGDSGTRTNSVQTRSATSFKYLSQKVPSSGSQKSLGRLNSFCGAEAGSAYRPGPRKGNGLQLHNLYDDCLDDVMSFGREHHRNHHSYRSQYVTHHKSEANFGTPCSKEQYLLAHCQFLVSDSAASKDSYLFNADAEIQWDSVEELRIVDESCTLSCPICLYPPVAAKMTRCGHVFCWPCILHYLSLSDKEWRKCPICYESVNKNNLTSAKIVPGKHFAVGDHIIMQLLRRPRGGSVIALPPKTAEAYASLKLLTSKDENAKFTKFLKVTRKEILETILAREREELEIQLALEGDEPESCFLHEGLQYLTEREAQLKAAVEENENSCSAVAENKTKCSRSVSEDRVQRSVAEQAVESIKTVGVPLHDNAALDEQDQKTLGDKSPCKTLDASTAQEHCEADKFFYFYQVDDGQHLYLHSFNARCISHEYGTLANGPEFVSGQIVDIERHVMTEELRRRFRYLSHLPLNTNFALIELQLGKDAVSRGTLEVFKAEYQKRQETRRRKLRFEKRHDVTAKRLEAAMLLDPANYSKYVSSPSMEIPITKIVRSGEADIKLALSAANLQDETSPSPPDRQTHGQPSGAFAMVFDDFAYPELGTQPVSPPTMKATTVVGAPPTANSIEIVNAIASPPDTRSFAEMLRSCTRRQRTTPSCSDITSSAAAVCVEEQSLLPPESTYADAIGDALEAALEAGAQEQGSNGGRKSKGKGRNKGRVLFSM